jgi:hypothetical protein
VLCRALQTYYGAALCVCWSPDAAFVASGGEDDLVATYSLAEKQVGAVQLYCTCVFWGGGAVQLCCACVWVEDDLVAMYSPAEKQVGLYSCTVQMGREAVQLCGAYVCVLGGGALFDSLLCTCAVDAVDGVLRWALMWHCGLCQHGFGGWHQVRHMLRQLHGSLPRCVLCCGTTCCAVIAVTMQVIAFGEGHNSWVMRVQFDPYNCGESTSSSGPPGMFWPQCSSANHTLGTTDCSSFRQLTHSAAEPQSSLGTAGVCGHSLEAHNPLTICACVHVHMHTCLVWLPAAPPPNIPNPLLLLLLLLLAAVYTAPRLSSQPGDREAVQAWLSGAGHVPVPVGLSDGGGCLLQQHRHWRHWGTQVSAVLHNRDH